MKKKFSKWRRWLTLTSILRCTRTVICDILCTSATVTFGSMIRPLLLTFRFWMRRSRWVSCWKTYLVSTNGNNKNCKYLELRILLLLNFYILFQPYNFLVTYSMKLYGPNSVEVEVKSYWTLFVDEVFNPFYLFQMFSIVLWSLDEYYQYATCVFILSACSCMQALHQTKQVNVTI